MLKSSEKQAVIKIIIRRKNKDNKVYSYLIIKE